MKVAIVTGSVRSGRQSHKAANYVSRKLNDRNIETMLIDIGTYDIVVMGRPEAEFSDRQRSVNAIGKILDDSDAIILVTPEYHGSFSGALKNALDYFGSEFSRKPVGVVAASAGRMGGINASVQLQHVILSLGAYPVPRKLLVPEIHNAFDDSFNALDNKVIESTEKFLDEFLWFAEAVYEKKTEINDVVSN